MRSKRIPPFVLWLVAGAVLFIISYVIGGMKLRICAISSCVAAFLWFLLPDFMNKHSQKLYGIWLIFAGLYLFFIGGSRLLGGTDGLLLLVLGIGFLIIT